MSILKSKHIERFLSNYKERYNSLDSYQKDFVDNKSNIIKVLANAGSGKTHSSIIKLFDFILYRNIDPKDLVLISYTSKASKLLKDRYYSFFKDSLSSVLSVSETEDYLETLESPWISTIHSFCYNLMLRKLKESNNTGNFTILNDYKSSKLLKSIIGNVFDTHYSLTESLETNLLFSIYYLINDIGQSSEYCYFFDLKFNADFTLKSINKDVDYSLINTSYSINSKKYFLELSDLDVNNIISERKLEYVDKFKNILQKSKKLPSHVLEKLTNSTCESLLSDILMSYFNAKISFKCLSFIDIIYFALSYNNQFKTLGSNYKAIIVDEAQDLDYLNFYLFKSLLTSNSSLILVGDPKQSLYSFRLADPNILDKLEKLFDSPVSCNYLLTNYRSTKTLVSLANEYSKSMASYFDVQPSKIVKDFSANSFLFKPFNSLDDELNFIVNDIEAKKNSGISYNDITLLARRNQSLIEIEPYLIKKRIPYKIKYDNNSLLNQSSFKFVYSLYSILLNPNDVTSLIDCLSFFKGLGEKTLDKIQSKYISNLKTSVNYNVFSSETISSLDSAFRSNIVKNIYEDILIPLKDHFNSNLFSTKSLNYKIHHILTRDCNYQENTYDGPVVYSNNTSKNLNIELTLDQIDKACRTLTSLFDSYSSDSSFKAKLEIEKFLEIYNALTCTQINKNDELRECVYLSSVHSFKGCESEIVYYFNLSSISPFLKSDELSDKCIIYVAATRAIKQFIASTSVLLKTFDGTLRKSNQNPHFSSYLESVKSIKSN